MRNLSVVLQDMINEVPHNEIGFIAALKSFRSSTRYAAPEFMSYWWREIAIYLSGEFPNPDQLNDWQRKVVGIWMNQSSNSSTIPAASTVD